MTSKTNSDDSVTTIHNPDYVYLIAGRLDAIDAHSRKMAKKINDWGYFYGFYGAMDGLILTPTINGYVSNIYYTNSPISSSDALHEWTLTPIGSFISGAEALTLITLSALGNYYSDSDSDEVKRFIAVYWPYFRDSVKGLKNAYKGVDSLLRVINLLGGANANFLMLPLALTVGGLAVMNRMWCRSSRNTQKLMKKSNEKALKEVLNPDVLSDERLKELKQAVREQSWEVRNKALAAAAVGGLIDSLYQFLGVASMASLAPPLFIPLTVLCIIYCVSLIIARVYEEYNLQRDFLITQARLELALYSKNSGRKIIQYLVELQSLSQKLSLLTDSEADESLRLEYEARQCKLNKLLQAKKSGLETRRQALKSLLMPSYQAAFFTGIQSGLSAYGVICSILFTITVILSLLSVSFPPLALLPIASLGMGCLILFILQAMLSTYKQRSILALNHNAEPYESLSATLGLDNELENLDVELNLKEKATQVLNEGMAVAAPPTSSLEAILEMLRLLWSGARKGPKPVELIFNSMQEQGSDSHYHDTPIMLIISIFSAILYAVTLTLREFARSFGRDPLPEENQLKVPKTTKIPMVPLARDHQQEPAKQPPSRTDEESCLPNERWDSRPSALRRTFSQPNLKTFFSITEASRSYSEDSLVRGDSHLPCTIQGSM